MLKSKSLILFRHGKSDWNADYSSDHQRPLAPRGVNAAKTMGKLLSASQNLPDLIICSTAFRARQTLDLAYQSGNWNSEIEFSDALYGCNCSTIITILQQLKIAKNSVMLVGHEPTWSSLTSLLIGGGSIRFPTAAMARIDFNCSQWQSIRAEAGELRWLLQPRFFKHTGDAG